MSKNAKRYSSSPSRSASAKEVIQDEMSFIRMGYCGWEDWHIQKESWQDWQEYLYGETLYCPNFERRFGDLTLSVDLNLQVCLYFKGSFDRRSANQGTNKADCSDMKNALTYWKQYLEEIDETFRSQLFCCPYQHDGHGEYRFKVFKKLGFKDTGEWYMKL